MTGYGKKGLKQILTSSLMMRLGLRPSSSGGIKDPLRLLSRLPAATEVFRLIGLGDASLITSILGASCLVPLTSGVLISGNLAFEIWKFGIFFSTFGTFFLQISHFFFSSAIFSSYWADSREKVARAELKPRNLNMKTCEKIIFATFDSILKCMT